MIYLPSNNGFNHYKGCSNYIYFKSVRSLRTASVLLRKTIRWNPPIAAIINRIGIFKTYEEDVLELY